MAGLFGAPRRLPNIDPNLGGMMAQERGGFGAPMAMPQQAPQAAPRKRGLFSKLGIKAEQVNALGALLQGDQNAVSQYHQMQQLPLLQQAQQEAEFADFQRRKQFEWQNEPQTPRVNDTIEDFNWYKSLSPEDRAVYDQMRPEYRQGPDGQFYRVQTQQGPAPTAPVGRLTPIGGGGAGNGTGNFPSADY